jgi:hypothetical protein
MNKLTQILTLTGIGTLAALAIGTGPAQAASSTGSAAAKAPTAATQQRHGWDRTAGYYRSARACEVAGRIGERFGRWDDHDCNFVRFGFRRGSWALQVSDRGWNGPGHNFPGHNFPGHNFPGHGGPAFPGQNHPGFPGGQGHDMPGGQGHDMPGGQGHDMPGSHWHNTPSAR